MRQMISSVESDCVLYVGRKLVVYRCWYNIRKVDEKKLPFIYNEISSGSDYGLSKAFC